MKLKIFLITMFILFAKSLYGQEFKKTATSGFVFLEIPVTARTAALGESSISLTDLNSTAVFNNPGALGFTESTHSFSVSYSPWIADVKNYASSYSFKSNLGVFALSMILFDYGDMPRTIIAEGQKVYQVLGNFSATSSAFGISYSKMLTDRFSFGMTVKYVNEKIDVYSANNILFDGGVIYFTGLGSLRIAASIQNFGVDTKFINDKFRMPAILRMGIAAEVLGDKNSDYILTLTTEANHASDAEERLSVGSEFGWRNMFFIRGGYKFFYDEETYSFGAGIKTNGSIPVAVDFAFSDYGRLGKITRFTLQLGL
ncbi:MAG: hypothetical protein Fur0015_02410 [Ignavibacteriales bacterium]